MKNYENFKISQAAKRYYLEQSMILNRLEDDLRDIKFTDSVTVNFLNQMKAMTNAGIELSTNILNFTMNGEMERVARNIQRGQEKLRKGIHNELRKREKSQNNDFENRKYIRESERILSHTVRDMRKTTPSGKVNCAYLKTILPFLDGWNGMIHLVQSFEATPGLQRETKQQALIITKQRQQARNAARRLNCR